MQVVVRKSSLSSGGDVIVLASYGDDIDVQLADQPQGTVILSVSDESIENTSVGMRLVKQWREKNKQATVSSEARRRITDVFPEDLQNN